MRYPSLLNRERASGKLLGEEIFEDLKLTLLLGPETIDAMREPAASEDIPVRQSLFRELFNPQVRESYIRLAADAGEIGRLASALADVRCDNERNCVYASLASAVVRFCEDAEKAGGESFFAERFRESFKRETKTEEFKAVSEACLNLAPMLREVRVNCFRISGETLRIRTESDVTVVSRLKKCAADLGLPESRVVRELETHMNPRFVNAVAMLRPECFIAFREFYEKYSGFYSEEILKYRSELNFYLEISAVMDTLRKNGMPVCMPAVSSERHISIQGLRDISLLCKDETNIVPNDAEFTEEEPFFFLTGANGGGKTTYLRGVGIATVFFLCGCPICADSAEIFPLDGVFTHFPRDERFDSEGRFADEQRRVGEIMKQHAGNSLVLLNETYSTTSEEIAVELTAKLAETCFDSGSFGIYITHQHGIGQSRIPFLAVLVDVGDKNRRTYRIARQRAASRSFAEDVLKKYGLTREALNARFPAGKEAAR